ncbi:uncharacterized protein LOC128212164 isoform X1 [Mya arenaria]|uniref:uncharacterized protein LOC128212164 isoform X1 n=1 Tax=Mya arenaria TaxID=6604 RepID=UPI0022E790E3|nr:uncharacterized protein LOC128212164 isoform X1 [Mya arenaria]
MNIHIFIVTLYTKLSLLSGLTKGQMFEIENGKINTTNPSVWVHDVSLGGCLDECKFRSSCAALSYHQFVNLCQLDLTPSPEVVPTKERGLLCWIKTTQEDHVECGQHSCKIGFVCNIRQKTCERKECSPLSIPSNTIILGNVNAVGAKIKMRCKEGYFATGPETITLTCGVNGAWSPQPLICKTEVGKSCSSVTDCPNNGYCSSNTCKCASGFVQDGKLCKATVGLACAANDDCADTTTTFCDTLAAESQCRKKVGQTCTTESDCPYNGDCHSSICACKSGFEQKGDFCNGRIISQWVESVVASSSEFMLWRASRIVGEPDGSVWSFWISSYWNNSKFIEVGFLNTVRVTTVEIYGIYQTVGIEIKCLQDEAYIRLYVGKVTPPERGVFAPTLERSCLSNQLRIEVFTGVQLSGNWMAIDAIRLNGTLV